MTFRNERVGRSNGAMAAFGVVLMLFLAQACGSNAARYEEASVGLGSALSFTALNRAITGDCWAQCSSRKAADRTGLLTPLASNGSRQAKSRAPA